LTQFGVWQVERGAIRCQWVVSSEAAMVALLEGAVVTAVREMGTP
jgi:hypothetical protein